MDRFIYRRSELHCEDVSVARIAADAGTPVYIYSAATLVDHYHAIARAFRKLNPLLCYSIKSCANVHICRLLRECGSGFDVVSGGELVRALEAGGDPGKIVFAGVGKTDAEIHQAIDAKIGWFNVESEAELDNLLTIARERGVQVRAALRVNPDVDPKTHRYTTTGKRENKFGVDLDRARRVFNTFTGHEVVRMSGIHLHLGSPVNSVEPYVQAIEKVLGLIDDLRRDGFAIEMLDIGGGFGAHYRAVEAPVAEGYAARILPLLEGRNLELIMEPGRSIAANAGILVTKVLYVKESGDRRFLIVDAGMNDLLRPALYDAYHFIWPVQPATAFTLEPGERGEGVSRPGLVTMDVVGPVCESADFLAHERRLPPMRRGDLVSVFSSGAYGMTMASHYNSRPKPPEVLVEGGSFRVIRRRESPEDLLAAERV